MPLTVPPPTRRSIPLPAGYTVGDPRTKGKSMIDVAASSLQPSSSVDGDGKTQGGLSAKAYGIPGTMEPLPRGSSKAVITRARPPILLKIAPDLTDDDKQDIADVCLSVGIDGLVSYFLKDQPSVKMPINLLMK
jgi:hypothetical protein